MRTELYTTVSKLTEEVRDEHISGKRPLVSVLGDKMAHIVRHAQSSVNRGLLAEAVYLASSGHDPKEVIAEHWAKMVTVIGEANTSKMVLASMFNMTFTGQEEASVVVLPVGEAKTFKAFNNIEELETALRSEPELVEQLIRQGRNRLSLGPLMEAAKLITDGQLAQYKEFLATMARFRRSDEWVVKVGRERTIYNVFGLKGIEAIKAAKTGKEPKANELAQGLGGITGWMVDAAINHRHVVDTIPTRNERGYMSPFWVEGHVDYGQKEYYPGEDPVRVRFAHFEQRESPGNNTVEAVGVELEKAHAEWVEVAEWIAKARIIHNAARKGVRPLTYRQRSGLETQSLLKMVDGSRQDVLKRAEEKAAEFAAKRAGGEIKSARDAEEGWKAAVEGVLDATQLEQLNKLREEMGFATDGKPVNTH